MIINSLTGNLWDYIQLLWCWRVNKSSWYLWLKYWIASLTINDTYTLQHTCKTQTDTQTQTDTHRHTQTDRYRHAHTDTDSCRHTHTDILNYINLGYSQLDTEVVNEWKNCKMNDIWLTLLISVLSCDLITPPLTQLLVLLRWRSWCLPLFIIYGLPSTPNIKKREKH